METLTTRVKRRVGEEARYFCSFHRPRRLLFDHMPKCGGSTLNVYLEQQYPKRKTFSLDGLEPERSLVEFRQYPQFKRHEYRLIKGHLAHQLVDYVHPETLKVTVLREPVDRMISHYFFAKRETQHYLHAKIVENDMSLEDYIESDVSPELRCWYTIHYSGLTLAEAQRDPSAAVAQAIEVIRTTYHLVGFLDEFSDFTEKLRQLAGFKTAYTNQRENVTVGRLPREEVPDSILRKTERINHMDVALYNHLLKLFR